MRDCRAVTAISIRKAYADDLRLMYQLDQRCFSAAFRFSFRVMSTFFYQPDAATFVAESSGVLAGFVIVQFALPEAYIVTLDVEPALRRSGVASLLMQEAEAAARLQQADSVGLHVWEENLPAIAFYESQGYLAVDRVHRYYGAGRDARIYRKHLTQG